MPLFADDDDKDAPKRGGTGTVLTKNLGPLPVWGWAVVAFAGVFLWRYIAGGAKKDDDEGAIDYGLPYPTGGVGGVFILPGPGGTGAGGAGGGGTSPGGLGHGVYTGPGGGEVSGSTLAQIGDLMRAGGGTAGLAALTKLPASDQAALKSLAAAAQTNAAGNSFLSQNVARKSLGAPYIVGGGPWGPAGVFVPETGKVHGMSTSGTPTGKVIAHQF